MSIKEQMLARYYQTRAELPDEDFTPAQLAVRNSLYAKGVLQYVPRLNRLASNVRKALRDWGRK